MGGCCCSCRKLQLHGTPVYYYCPPALEEQESLTSHDSVATALTSGFLFDLNLDTSTPDTYRPPPRPIPYNVVLGHPQSTDSISVGKPVSCSNFETSTTCMIVKESDFKAQAGFSLASPRKFEIEILKPNITISPAEEEDFCPTCLEEYDSENPRIITKCNHHFHLSCILEWRERSDTCPICDQEMIIEAL